MLEKVLQQVAMCRERHQQKIQEQSMSKSLFCSTQLPQNQTKGVSNSKPKAQTELLSISHLHQETELRYLSRKWCAKGKVVSEIKAILSRVGLQLSRKREKVKALVHHVH